MPIIKYGRLSAELSFLTVHVIFCPKNGMEELKNYWNDSFVDELPNDILRSSSLER